MADLQHYNPTDTAGDEADRRADAEEAATIDADALGDEWRRTYNADALLEALGEQRLIEFFCDLLDACAYPKYGSNYRGALAQQAIDEIREAALKGNDDA